MTSEPPVLSASAQLPNELCREIAESLHYFTDRNTLLCLALVSKAWCAESQRVLFRTVCDDSVDLDKRASLIHTHTLFLKTIILNPTQLGPYVRAYKQRELIRHPFFRADSEILLPGASSVSYLWDLTARALPAFVNLKHLFITPQLDGRRRIPRAYLLEGCTFKLESLIWGFEPYDPNSSDPFFDFLRTQHDLLHLEDEPSRKDFSCLPDDVCPSLTSTTCRLDAAARVMTKRRHIVGLKVWSDWSPWKPDPQNDLSKLHRLKYLSISAHHDLMSHWGTNSSHIVLLELTSWCHRTIQILYGLSNLRVLALLREPREDPASMHPRHRVMSMKAETNLRIQLTMESFRRCPNLEHVIIQDIYRGQGPLCYRKLSVAEFSGKSNAEQEIQSEEFLIYHDPGMPWWTAYGMQ